MANPFSALLDVTEKKRKIDAAAAVVAAAPVPAAPSSAPAEVACNCDVTFVVGLTDQLEEEYKRLFKSGGKISAEDAKAAWKAALRMYAIRLKFNSMARFCPKCMATTGALVQSLCDVAVGQQE